MISTINITNNITEVETSVRPSNYTFFMPRASYLINGIVRIAEQAGLKIIDGILYVDPNMILKDLTDGVTDRDNAKILYPKELTDKTLNNYFNAIDQKFIDNKPMPGPKGDIPKHEWNGKLIRFEQPDGSWGPWQNIEGQIGPIGPKGDMPRHEMNGTFVRFERPNGEWGPWLNIIGPEGPRGQALRPNKFYETIQAMMADINNVQLTDIALIQSRRGAEDEDNAKLYIVEEINNVKQWIFMSDLSGPSGSVGIYELDKESTNIIYVAELHVDKSFSNPNIQKINIVLPETVSHGFITSVNFISGSTPPNVTITNNSVYPLKLLLYSLSIPVYVPNPNKMCILSIFCDGIYVYCFITEV